MCQGKKKRIDVFPIGTLVPCTEGSRRDLGLSQVIRLYLLRSQTQSAF